MLNENNLFHILDYKKEPTKIAIIEAETDNRVTYIELERYSNRIANWLLKNNLQQGDRLAICASNSINYFSMLLAIWKIGATAILINKKLAEDQIGFVLKDSNSKIIFTDIQLNYEIKQINIINLNVFDQPTELEYIVNDNFPALIIYTSGTSGNPKGIQISHKNHRWIIEKKSTIPNAEKMRTIISAPICHMNGLSNLEVSIASHATAILLSEFKADSYINAIKNYKATQLSGVPTMMDSILSHKLITETDLSTVRHILLGSAPITEILYDKIKSFFKNASVTISYGISEVGPGLFGRHPNGLETPKMSVGYPIDGIEYRIENGILYIKSPSIMKGYDSLKEENITEDGFYKTNDLFSIDHSGFFYFEGRADDMFVCGGHNIFPQNVELILSGFNEIKEIVVIGIPDQNKGFKPYSFVVPKNKFRFSSEELNYYAKKKLSNFEIPRKFWIIEELPRNSIGKIDKQKLIELAKIQLNKELLNDI